MLRDLYLRFRQLIHEGAKFGVVGLIGFLVTDGGTNLLRAQFQLGWLKANVIATVAATIVTFLGSRYWTFRHRERTAIHRETILFFVLNGIGPLIQLACLGFTNYALGLTDKFSSNVALLIGIVLGTLFRFWSYRRFVWVERRDATAGVLPEAVGPQAELLEPAMTPSAPAGLADSPQAQPSSQSLPAQPLQAQPLPAQPSRPQADTTLPDQARPFR